MGWYQVFGFVGPNSTRRNTDRNKPSHLVPSKCDLNAVPDVAIPASNHGHGSGQRFAVRLRNEHVDGKPDMAWSTCSSIEQPRGRMHVLADHAPVSSHP